MIGKLSVNKRQHSDGLCFTKAAMASWRRICLCIPIAFGMLLVVQPTKAEDNDNVPLVVVRRQAEVPSNETTNFTQSYPTTPVTLTNSVSPTERAANTTDQSVLNVPTKKSKDDIVYCKPVPTPPNIPAEYGNFSMHVEEQFVKIYEDRDGHIDIKISNLEKIIKLEIESKDTVVFEVLNGSVHFNPDEYEIHNGTLTVHLKGLQLGVSSLVLTVYDEHGKHVIKEEVRFTVKTLRIPRLIDAIFTYLLLPLIVVSCAGMGCKMEIEIIKMKLKKPVGILVGPVCQFICQPFFAFAISKFMKFDGLTALGLVTVGSCPGGGMSNMITLLIGADLIQSVTMTFTSNLCALAMLPLNMFIYGNHFMKKIVAEGGDGASFKIPITDIMFQIALLAGPVLIGMAIRYKLPKVAYYVNKSLGVLSLTLLLLTLGIGVYSNIYVFTTSSWQIMVGAALLPIFGFITGFLVARFLTRQPLDSSMTVSVETGVQNNLIAISMIKLAYPQPESDMMARMPIIVSITALSVGVGMVIASVPVHRFRKDRKAKQDKVKDLDDQYDRVTYRPVSTKESKLEMEHDIPPSYRDANGTGRDRETDV